MYKINYIRNWTVSYEMLKNIYYFGGIEPPKVPRLIQKYEKVLKKKYYY